MSGHRILLYSCPGRLSDGGERLIKAKENWARARRSGKEREVVEAGNARLPPGQHLIETWPVLDLGYRPDIPLPEWRLTVNGFVANPIAWT